MSIVRGVVSVLSAISGDSVSAYTRSGILYDFAIGDLPLLAATSKEVPFRRTSAPVRKQQFDNAQNPGEQSLEGWWLRSQQSFDGGAGLNFLEPASNAKLMTRFKESKGVNVWTPGRVSLLKRTTQKKVASGNCLVEGAIDGTTDIYLHADNATLTRETAAGTTAITWGGAGTITSLAQDGDNYYAANSVGIYRGTLAGGAGAKIWDTGSTTVIGWAKQRLVAGIGPSLYELISGGPTLPTALYTHPTSTWTWTAITEGPSAIFASGYAGGTSAIYKFVLDSAGVMPTLTSGVVAASMPTGEIVHSIQSYLGAFIVIGTNKGVRIGVIAENGDISYGPLVIESTEPVYDSVGLDRFVFVTCTNQIDGASGLWRIDLGNEVEDGRFAYATDLQAMVEGTVRSVSLLGASGRLVFGVDADGSYLEHETELEAEGTLRTAFIRFNTVEPKIFKYVRLRSRDLMGALSISTVDATDATQSIFTLNEGVSQDGDINLQREDPEEFLAMEFTLTRNASDATEGATLNSYQLKALPAIRHPRLIRIPVLLFKEMADKKGAKLPPMNPVLVLSQLEELEATSDTHLFVNLNTSTTEVVTIEEIDFIQTAPPAANCKGEGGIAYITLRTIQ